MIKEVKNIAKAFEVAKEKHGWSDEAYNTRLEITATRVICAAGACVDFMLAVLKAVGYTLDTDIFDDDTYHQIINGEAHTKRSINEEEEDNGKTGKRN